MRCVRLAECYFIGRMIVRNWCFSRQLHHYNNSHCNFKGNVRAAPARKREFNRSATEDGNRYNNSYCNFLG